jgi:hypothetical protein
MQCEGLWMQCEGLWMPAGRGDGVGNAAGVRKPPGKEPAGRRTSGGVMDELYGDLAAAEDWWGWV